MSSHDIEGGNPSGEPRDALVTPRHHRLPFQITEQDEDVVIRLAVDAGLHPDILDPRSWTWIDGRPGRIIVDISRLRVINSPLCGWLINLMRSAPSRCVVLAGANARVRETLHLLKFDSLISVVA